MNFKRKFSEYVHNLIPFNVLLLNLKGQGGSLGSRGGFKGGEGAAFLPPPSPKDVETINKISM